MNVIEAILNRRSVRAYSPKAIPTDVMQRMRQALRSAPSACNIQPWRFVFVQDGQLRQEISAAGGQKWMAGAPVIVAACGYQDRAFKGMGGYGNSIDVDLAIAVDHLTLAAVADGLGTCWIGAFDESKVKKIIGVPDDVKIVAMTPLGYPAAPEMIAPLDDKRRKADAEIFSVDRF